MADARHSLDLSKYRCSEFLSDAEKLDTPGELLKSMMMIAWATGYAAAHQKNALPAAVSSFRAMADVLGDICRRQPNELCVTAVARAVDEFVAANDGRG